MLNDDQGKSWCFWLSVREKSRNSRNFDLRVGYEPCKLINVYHYFSNKELYSALKFISPFWEMHQTLNWKGCLLYAGHYCRDVKIHYISCSLSRSSHRMIFREMGLIFWQRHYCIRQFLPIDKVSRKSRISIFFEQQPVSYKSLDVAYLNWSCLFTSTMHVLLSTPFSVY